jgi:recombination protein RecA
MPNKEVESFVKLLTKDMKLEEGIVTIYGDKNSYGRVERVLTSSPELNELLGGGVPRSRMIEIYGPESSGKSSLTLFIAACFQQSELDLTDVRKVDGTKFKDDETRKGVVAFIDVEQALDPKHASDLGLDFNDLIFIQPDTAEQAIDIAVELCKSGLIDLVILDSVAALLPEKEDDEDSVGDANIGLTARLMSKACRKLTPHLKKTKCTMIWINQIRMKIGGYGNPETTTGGNALKFYSSIRVETRSPAGNRVMEKDTQIGMITDLKTVKNKTSPPHKRASMRLIFGEGYDTENEWVRHMAKHDIIKKGGAGWYTVNGEKMQGEKAVQAYLEDNPELYEEYKEKTNSAILQKQEEKKTSRKGKANTKEEDKIVNEEPEEKVELTTEEVELEKAMEEHAEEDQLDDDLDLELPDDE